MTTGCSRLERAVQRIGHCSPFGGANDLPNLCSFPRPRRSSNGCSSNSSSNNSSNATGSTAKKTRTFTGGGRETHFTLTHIVSATNIVDSAYIERDNDRRNETTSGVR